MVKTIGNPLSWTAQAMGQGGRYIGTATQEIGGADAGPVEIRRIGTEDLRVALRRGWEDFLACRSDVIFICTIYPVIGLCLMWLAFNRDLLPLLFPLLSGFALIGPVAAIGLYEMSRRREQGRGGGWGDAFRVMGSPAFGALVLLGIYLLGVFVVWLLVATGIYTLTLGPEPPASAGAFLRDIFTTGAGWVMLVTGMIAGFGFAAFVLAMTVVSFPLLLDRQVGVLAAVAASFRLSAENPRTVALWGLIVAAGLLVGMATLFIGLIVVLPVLGHATWHLYRRAVVPAASQKAPPAPA